MFIALPVSLVVQVAEEFDITLLGFLRENHLTIYHGREHMAGNALQSAQFSAVWTHISERIASIIPAAVALRGVSAPRLCSGKWLAQ
jgi:hypothetical protein